MSDGGPVGADDAEAPPGLVADLRRVLLVSARVLRSHTASDEVTSPQFSVLAFLERAGESTPGEIASFEYVSPPVMTRTLARLQAAGLVDRAAHPTDGRQVRVALSAAGHEAVRRGREERDAWVRTRLGTLTERERAVLAEAVEVLGRSFLDRRPPARPADPAPPA